jgi:PAS domain S-box-containing protein
MGKISFLVPHASMVPYIKEVLIEYGDIHVEYCTYDLQSIAVKKLHKEGYDTIIARPGTASRIKRLGYDINVVELAVTSFDIIRAVESAKKFGTNIAIAAYCSMVKGIDFLGDVLNVSLKQYLTYFEDNYVTDIERLVLQAAQEGADVIVGGGIFCELAQKHGIPAVFIDSGSEGIIQAMEEALRIQKAVEAEKVKIKLFESVLDNVHDGIITVNRKQNVTTINLRAQKMLNISSSEALGKNISSIWPDFDISHLIKTGEKETNKIIQVNDLKVLCNKVPIIVSHMLRGALVTFQDITKIQQTEARIRKEVYSKGHVAKMSFADVLGTSPATTRTIELAKEFASTNSNILIVGESGTGKEVFAQSIHNHSSRRSGPFVAVNCAALPGQILESELFGYVGGAFTGANKEGKPGLFELAHGGTIFLDEVTEMDYTNQSRLLRVLQERSIMRLGSDRIISVDIRVIAATNRDLKELILERKFREDLFYRLNVLKLELPPLRERKQDIKIMAENFLNKHSLSRRKLTLDSQAVKALESYGWPGNIRELQNTMERLVAFCQTETVRASDVDAVLEKWQAHPVKASFQDDEIQEIMDALTKARGVQSEAAKLLGIDRTTLWRKMRRLGIRV